MISRTAQLPSSSTSLLDALMIPAILLAAIVTLVAIDFTQWRAFGTGGTPPTWQGYIKIRKWGWYRFWQFDDLTDASKLPNEGIEYLNKASIPLRSGPRPGLTRWILPQRQHKEPITPKAQESLNALLTRFTTPSHPASLYITSGPSKTEGGTGPALYVKPSCKTINPVAHKIFYEIGHVHPNDNSLHVYLSPKDARTIVERGWGVRFSVGWIAPASWIMVYAPRDEAEVKIVGEIVRAAICFAVGQRV